MKAPIPELLWYMAIFRRTFCLMEQAAADDDDEGMWLTQWAADALHNVPRMLRDYDEKACYSPGRTRLWVSGLSRQMQHLRAPESVCRAAARLVDASGSAESLGLDRDLEDLDLAAGDALEQGLEGLFHACLITRQCMPREALLVKGWGVTRSYGRQNRILGAVAKELPWGLVHWKAFDLPAFEEQMHAAYVSVGARAE